MNELLATYLAVAIIFTDFILSINQLFIYSHLKPKRSIIAAYSFFYYSYTVPSQAYIIY